MKLIEEVQLPEALEESEGERGAANAAARDGKASERVFRLGVALENALALGIADLFPAHRGIAHSRVVACDVVWCLKRYANPTAFARQ